MDHWWTSPTRFADWRNVPFCDFTTNGAPYKWYSGRDAGGFRPLEFKPFLDRVENGDTVWVGLDYYSMNISSGITPDGIRWKYGYYLWNGGVLVVGAVGNDSLISFFVKQ